MKKQISSLFLLFSLCGFSQQLVKTIDISLSKKTNVFQVVDEQKNQIALFFSDKTHTRTALLDNKFNVMDSIVAPLPSENLDDVIGYSVTGNKYFSYWSNSSCTEIISQGVDFENKQVTKKAFNIEYQKEKIIKKITVNNVFYLISIIKNSNKLNFYVFDNENLVKKEVDLSSFKFLNNYNELCSLWDVLNKSSMIETALSIQSIKNETPPSLAFSSNKRKVYTKNNKLVFTFDTNNNFTQTISINLSDFIASQKNYTKPFFEIVSDIDYTDSNSFLLDDKIILTKLNSSKLVVSVNDLDGNELKNFSVNAEDEIPFKNSEIIQENGGVNHTRILDSSNQLIRKINNNNPSLSCYSSNDKYYLTIGGVSPIQNNSAILYGGMIGGFTGALIGAAISSNYSMDNLNSYANRKVIYINCLFDKDFNHIDGNAKKLAFDELRYFTSESNKLTCQTIFKIGNTLYYGGYDKKENKYSFYQFND